MENKMILKITPNSLPELSLPIDGISPQAQTIATSLAETYQSSLDMVLSAMFAAVGVACGNRVTVHDGKYCNRMNLYLCYVAKSGSNKSFPVREVLKPLSSRNAANYELFKQELKDWKARVQAGEKDPEKPRFKQVLLGDSTPESRNKVLSENRNGLMLYSDELKSFLDNIGRYNRSGEASDLLSIFDGNDVLINRKSEEPLLIQHPFLTIMGGIQPDVLESTFGSDLFMSNGLNQRFLFVYPDEQPPAMYSEATISRNITEAWDRFINGLIDANFETLWNGKLLFDTEAKKLYIDYYNILQRKKAEADNYMCSVYSKLQIIVQRWAGITHMMGENVGVSRILPQEMEYSIRCMDYFERCALKVYQKLTEGKKQPLMRMPSKEEIIALCYNSFPTKSKQSFADALGVSRQFVSKAVQKHPKLRGCGCDPIGESDNEVDEIENTATTNDLKTMDYEHIR